MITCPECETIFIGDNLKFCTECGYVFDEFDDDFDDD